MSYSLHSYISTFNVWNWLPCLWWVLWFSVLFPDFVCTHPSCTSAWSREWVLFRKESGGRRSLYSSTMDDSILSLDYLSPATYSDFSTRKCFHFATHKMIKHWDCFWVWELTHVKCAFPHACQMDRLSAIEDFETFSYVSKLHISLSLEKSHICSWHQWWHAANIAPWFIVQLLYKPSVAFNISRGNKNHTKN